MLLKKNITHPWILGVCKNKHLLRPSVFFQDLSILAQAFASWRHGESGPKVAQFLRAEAMRQMQVPRVFPAWGRILMDLDLIGFTWLRCFYIGVGKNYPDSHEDYL